MTIQFDRQYGLPIAAAIIVGPTREVDVRLLIDSGSAFTMVRPAVLVAAGYDLSRPRSHVAIASATEIATAPLFVIDAVRAIEVERRNVATLAHEFPSGLAFQGVLGVSFFRDRRLIVDFRARQVSLD